MQGWEKPGITQINYDVESSIASRAIPKNGIAISRMLYANYAVMDVHPYLPKLSSLAPPMLTGGVTN